MKRSIFLHSGVQSTRTCPPGRNKRVHSKFRVTENYLVGGLVLVPGTVLVPSGKRSRRVQCDLLAVFGSCCEADASVCSGSAVLCSPLAASVLLSSRSLSLRAARSPLCLFCLVSRLDVISYVVPVCRVCRPAARPPCLFVLFFLNSQQHLMTLPACRLPSYFYPAC